MVTAPSRLPQLARSPLRPVQPEDHHAFAQHGPPAQIALTKRPRPARMLTVARAVRGQEAHPHPYSDPSNYLG